MLSKYQRPKGVMHLFRLRCSKRFKWMIGATYELIWINMYSVCCAWKPHKGSNLETVTIPPKHVDLPKTTWHILLRKK